METAASNANSYMQKKIKEKADIKEVRSRLAKISVSMAQEIVENRAERL